MENSTTHRFRFSLRTMLLVVSAIGVVLGLWQLRHGEILTFAFATLVFIAMSFLAKNRQWRRVVRCYAAAMTMVCLAFLPWVSSRQLFLIGGLRIPGPPSVGFECVLLVGVILLLFLGTVDTFRVIRRGSWMQRAACSLPAVFFLSLYLLALMAPATQQTRARAVTTLFYLRGCEGRAVLIGPNGRQEINYKNRQRHGFWRVWDAQGNLIHECEYRNGEPWDGVCYIYEFKAWIGEFKQGRPWKGYLDSPETGEANFYLDGQIVTKDVYCRDLGIDGEDYGFWGLCYWKVNDERDKD